ncbi:MAG: hypothetical protein JNM24_04090, partial [Bdellovibrionaceae bacterium]|nr:hypothetical protein [Pseudobdellovibrionaceae bacterium]
MRSDIIKLIVHKIEILKDGFEIHFHVGQAHYDNALQGQTLGAIQGRGWIDKAGDNGLGGKQSGGNAKGGKKTKENPSGLLGPSGGFSNFGIESQNLNFFKRVGSSRLTNGAGDVQVVEPPDAIKTVLVRWNSVKIDLNELARLRWIKKMSLLQICK